MPILITHALSPLHAGSGHSPGAIDLPIARDKATGFPIVPGSGLKGALRADYAQRSPAPAVAAASIFGPETTNANVYAGALWVGDANLLCLPVRSVVGTFAWVTSPLLIERFLRDAREAGIPDGGLRAAPTVPGVETCATVANGGVLREGNRVFLEDLDFTTAASNTPLWAGADTTAEWLARTLFSDDPWRAQFLSRFCLVHDNVMSYLSTHATDVRTRIRLENETKTVAKGALWTEESLPTETILAAVVHIAPNGQANRQQVNAALNCFHERTLRLGADASVGHGRCRLRVIGGGA